MSITYKYNNGSGEIDNDTIIQVNSDGLLQSYGERGFKFTPQENLTKNVLSADGFYQDNELEKIQKRTIIDSFSGYNGIDKDNTNIVTKVEYYFGIDNINPKYILNDKTCGFISKNIKIDSCSYIKLSVISNQDISNIEFYIIDGIKEYPILPIETERVKEKLFYNLDTRFTIDKTKEIIIYKNNEATSLSLDDINSLDFNSNVYTIEYTPAIQHQIYNPTQDNIKLKLIQRIYNDNDIPANIIAMTILKYGGSKIWNI
jgi:hypothetical protein